MSTAHHVPMPCKSIASWVAVYVANRPVMEQFKRKRRSIRAQESHKTVEGNHVPRMKTQMDSKDNLDGKEELSVDPLAKADGCRDDLIPTFRQNTMCA